MKKSFFILALTVFVAGTVVTSCKSPQEKVDTAKANVEEASQDLEEAKENYNEEYNKFKLESDERISDNERMITELRDRSRNMTRDAKAKYELQIIELEERNEALKTKIKEYKNEGNEKWDSFKSEFNHDMDELGKALKDITKDNVK